MPAECLSAPENNGAPASSEGLATDITFASLGVPAPMVEVLDADGIITPFPIQAATLTDALAGRDILGRARTGSGKTLGFSLPLVARLAGGHTSGGQPRGLVLVPTRELAHQVQEVLRPLARSMGLWVTTIYGGVAYGPQITALQKRTDIVVATPGRLADLITQGECDLSEVEVTVIDEADQMADLGFLPIVRRMLEATPEGGQRMLFSATLDSAIDVLARRFLSDPALHSVDENSSPAEIEHHVLTIAPADRVGVVTALAGGEKRSLVFTRTKHGAERLAKQLTEAGIPAAELHGNLRQGARSRNLAAFASGIARVMVATDIAARGIDIAGIDLVVHADPPTEHKAYVHRSGRTARGGADGMVVTLQTKSQSRDITQLMKKAGITPHEAVTVDPESAEIRDIVGEPAPRVQVDRKVAELVRPEDRLGERGAGRPGGGPGGSRRDRKRRGDRGFGDREFGDRARGRTRRDAGDRPRADWQRPGRVERAELAEGTTSPAATDRPKTGRPVSERPERSERFDSGNRGERPARNGDQERNPRFDRGDRFERGARRDDPESRGGSTDRFGWDNRPARPARDDRYGRSDRPARDDRGDRFSRDDRSAPPARDGRNDRFGRDDRPTRFDRDARPGRDDRPARFSDGNRFGQRGQDDRFRRDERGERGFGDRGFGDRGDRNDVNGRDRAANDWWPRSNGGGARTAGSGWRASGPGSRSGAGNRGFTGSRPARENGSAAGERPARDGRGESSWGNRTSAGRGGRQEPGGRFGGTRGRSGYSGGRGTAGNRQDSGRGRHF
jgi:superfamily II DNA/RNA helicase